VICDRATIRTAILQAQPGDGILIAGKGHEDYKSSEPKKSTLMTGNKRTALMEGKIDVTIAPYLLASASAIQYSLKLDNMTQYGQTGLNFRSSSNLYEQALRASSTLAS